ncbi:MAG: nucleoside recognition domain-containing protein [Crocinitomicaceae bacterium]|jgi:spore maturation protein SpmA|nr:nucleoside recognition domain-containing protein [Crocinitomicaceae bacterium]
MLLNRIFIGMFLIGFGVAAAKLFFWGDLEIFKSIVDSLFSASKLGFELALYLTGALCLWMGFMRIGEKGGAVLYLSKAVSPLFKRLFPEVPADHPAVGSIMMNFSANMLGLDNAATPLGLKAMTELQQLNPEKDKASNAQIMFLVLNTSGLTLIPVSILAYRSIANSDSPSEVFLPILLTTFCSTIVGLLFVGIRQKINMLHPVVIAYLGGLIAMVSGLIYLVSVNPDYAEVISKVGGNVFLVAIITSFFLLAMRKKVNVYDEFIEGAKGGFDVALMVIPYLVAMLAALAVFRASGALDGVLDGIKWFLIACGLAATEFIDALPVALMKPFSGSGARGLMLEAFDAYGVDSFRGKVAATFQGSTETTFYVLAVYFGSVGIKNTRYAAGAGLIADLAGIIAAIFISYMFYTVN